MNRTIKNTGAVLVLTLLTAMAVYATVQTTAAIAGIGGASAASTASAAGTSSDLLTCPRTGCTASYCHATSGGAPRGSWQ